MKTIVEDANMEDSAETCMLFETSVEDKELLEDLTYYKTASKEISDTRGKTCIIKCH